MAVDKGPGNVGPAAICDVCGKTKLLPFFTTTSPVRICNDHTFEGYDARPDPGICWIGQHAWLEVYHTARGDFCLAHLRQTLKVAVWPKGWP